jgi:xanthine dehydrogenase YagR molybdenum-binding subunit
MATTVQQTPAVGAPLSRLEGREKVTGQARYATEQPIEGVAHVAIVQSPVAHGRVVSVDDAAALALPGVLAVVWHANAPRLAEVDDHELALFQDDRVSYLGQMVAAVVAETPEIARDAAERLDVRIEPEPHDALLRADHPDLYAPESVNAGFPTDSVIGDVDAGLATAATTIDVTYTTPALHNNAMEPHASLALWDASGLTVYDSTQGAATARDTVAQVFELEPDQVRVISHHVGGGFGSKGTPRPNIVLAAMAARLVGRPAQYAVRRQQMFHLTGYRTPTIQRLQLGADVDGRLTAIVHEAAVQTSQLKEFVEQVVTPTRTMYAAPNRRTTHRVVALNVPTPSWMRAPGECPGMYGLESAMDELAYATGIDPIELRVRNEPPADPEAGTPWSSRNLVACLREGAQRFGWEARDPAPRSRRDGRWLVGLGVAASTYPAYRSPAQASVRREGDGRFVARIAAADIGTGARTALTQIAADTLGVAVEQVRVEIGDSAFPRAPVAGGSMGTASWGTAIVRACERLLETGGDEAQADTTDEVKAQAERARHGFGAHFVEAWVDATSGEVRVERMLGVFAVGRIINAKTARSQFIGGMTMGVGMALMEESIMDARFGDFVNHDLADYHVPVCADVRSIDATWIDERDDDLNPMGSKGIGEIGIVGAAAAVANAVHHATGIRVRDLPIRLDKLVG